VSLRNLAGDVLPVPPAPEQGSVHKAADFEVRRAREQKGRALPLYRDFRPNNLAGAGT